MLGKFTLVTAKNASSAFKLAFRNLHIAMRLAVGPVQLQPPGTEIVDRHFITLLLIAPSTARFLMKVPLKIVLSTGQRL